MASIFVRVGICVTLFSGATNRLPPTPYDTPHSVPCNKADFRIYRRHAAEGDCEQRMMAIIKMA